MKFSALKAGGLLVSALLSVGAFAQIRGELFDETLECPKVGVVWAV